MIEANPANYVNLKFWGPQNSYATNDLVMYANGIYKASTNIPVNQPAPNADVRWVFQDLLIEDEVASGDSFRKLRVNHNTTSLAMKAFLNALETSGMLLWRGAFAATTAYKKGHVVSNGVWGNIYVAKANFTSGATFNASDWDLMVDLTGITPINEIKTASFAAVAGTRYFVNSLGGAINITLPASPTINTRPIWVTHIDGDVLSPGTAVTILRNGANIMGYAEDLAIDKNFASFMLAYSDTTHGWRVTII